MKSKKIALRITMVAALMLLFALWQRGTLDLLVLTHISFYGKVVDEKGNPVPAANVSLSFVDTFWDNHTKRADVTDHRGLFHASGHGLGVVVMVSKEGYYQLTESDGTFNYSGVAGKTNRHLDSTDPALFVLRKGGKFDSQIITRRRIYKIAEGVPVEIDLATGSSKQSGPGDIRVEAWIHDEGIPPNSNAPYDWNCIITVLGGGLVPRLGKFDFEAPVDGYVTSDEIKMPTTLGSTWRNNASKDYFVELKNGTYARLQFLIGTSHVHQFELTSFLNPQSGSRNLESDPGKRAEMR